MSDIDFGGKVIDPIVPSDTWFDGYFSGDGHTISNFTINSSGDNVGLFGYIYENATIMNLGVVGGKVTGGNSVGTICGYSKGLIANCYVFADVKATGDYAGGVCGQNNGSTVKNCYFVGTVNGTDKVAPVANGSVIGNNITVGSVDNCYYNKDLYTDEVVNGGTGLTTLEMTGADALTKMNSPAFMMKKANDTENGILYYLSFSEDNASSVGYTTELTFTKASPEKPVLDGEIEFTVGLKLNFDNGAVAYCTSPDYFSVNVNTEAHGEILFFEGDQLDLNADKITFNGSDTITEAGDVKFTLVYWNPYSAFCTKRLTKELVVNVEKKTLTAGDFKFTAPTDLVFDGTAKLPTVTTALNGVGEIKVKYYDTGMKQYVSEPINAGTYTVMIDVAKGKNYKAAADLSADTWTFTIAKAPALTLPDINVSYRWSTDEDITVTVAEIPDNDKNDFVLSQVISGDISGADTLADDNCFADGQYTFHLGTNTVDDIGKTGTIEVRLVSRNYEHIEFNVKITLTNKDNQEAPDETAFDIEFTNNGDDLIATIKTTLKDVEYSFDGTTWSSENTMTIGHDKSVTAYIRLAETDENNASPAVSKTANSGHGTPTHHKAVEATCQHDGNTEYWECKTCGKYFGDEAAATEIALADTVLAKTDHKWLDKYESDKDGHWHKCEYCDEVTEKQSHISSGEATTTSAEYCTECGYIISPKKNGGSTSGGHYSGGSGYRDTTPTETKPEINGTEKSWTDIAADLSKMIGGTVVITLNGETTLPADVIKAIADSKITAEIISDSTKSWIIDGAEITTVSAVDLSILPGSADTSALRGVPGVKLKLNAENVPADLKVAFKNQYAGEFANIYKLVNGKLVFQNCVKLANDGTAVLPDMAAGEYAVMVSKYTDLLGDVNNDGIVDVRDAASLLRYTVRLEQCENLPMGEMNNDSIVDLADALTVLRKAVGLTA